MELSLGCVVGLKLKICLKIEDKLSTPSRDLPPLPYGETSIQAIQGVAYQPKPANTIQIQKCAFSTDRVFAFHEQKRECSWYYG